MIELNHLDGGAAATSDLRCQHLPEDRHLLAIWRSNVRWKVSLCSGFTSKRSKQE
jgi:hypothetical protein